MSKLKISVIVLGLAGLVGLSLGDTTNPGTLRAPTVKTGAVTTSIYWSAGTVFNGGHTVTITAGNAALGASKVDCTPPSFATCDILYTNSGGTVAVTTAIGTAAASGNVILAYIETSAGSVPVNIAPANMIGTWTTASAAVAGTNAIALTGLSPAAAAGTSVGTNALPFTGLYLGTALTNNIFLTAAATSAARVITLPDLGATAAFGIQDPSVATKQLLFNTSGATGAATLASTLLASRTITLADPGGAAATLAYTNPTSAQTLVKTTMSQTSAVAYNSLSTFPMPVGPTYTSITDISGQQWFSSIYIPTSVTLTGACELNGTATGTDNVIVALWDSTGALLANSALAGTLLSGNSIYQCQAFTAPVAVTGPARYFVGIQGNGTKATAFTMYVAGSAPTGYAVGITVAGSFGTITNITPTASFTAGQGPVMSVY